MHAIDLIGCIASGLVLLTFYVNDMISLRTAALCSNVAFIIYAASLHLMPILLLHSILIPINLWRMISALCTNDRCGIAEVPWKALSRLVNLASSRGTKEGQLAYGRNVGRWALFEVDTDSREENASKQQAEPRSDSIGTDKDSRPRVL